MVYVFALSAGFCYALASVLQHRVAAAQPANMSLRPRLLHGLRHEGHHGVPESRRVHSRLRVLGLL